MSKSYRESLKQIKDQANVQALREKFENHTIHNEKSTPKKQNVVLRSQSTRSSTTLRHRQRRVLPSPLPMESQISPFENNFYENIQLDLQTREQSKKFRPDPPPKPKPSLQTSSESKNRSILRQASFDLDSYSCSVSSFDSFDEPLYSEVCDPFCDNPKTIADKTHFIIQELLDTERRYIESLKSGINDYIVPFDKVLLPKTLIGKKLEIFCNIEEIYEIHEARFLPKLLECGYCPVKIATVFIDSLLRNRFDKYKYYVRDRETSCKICNDDKYFFKQLQKDGLGINSFLLQPVQRLPRYQLMLGELAKELMKNLDHNKEAIARCCEAEKAMQNFLNIVNKFCDCNK